MKPIKEQTVVSPQGEVYVCIFEWENKYQKGYDVMYYIDGKVRYTEYCDDLIEAEAEMEEGIKPENWSTFDEEGKIVPVKYEF